MSLQPYAHPDSFEVVWNGASRTPNEHSKGLLMEGYDSRTNPIYIGEIEDDILEPAKANRRQWGMFQGNFQPGRVLLYGASLGERKSA